MSELPAYRSSPIGMARNRPFKRPAEDSLPVIDCDDRLCGLRYSESWGWPKPNYELLIRPDYTRWGFCSLGCLGRWAARMELRA